MLENCTECMFSATISPSCFPHSNKRITVYLIDKFHLHLHPVYRIMRYLSIQQFAVWYPIAGVMKMYRRIRDLREDKDKTQREVGEAINVPQRTYAYYESGERMVPPQVLVALAQFYNVSVDYLLELTDQKTPYPHKK